MNKSKYVFVGDCDSINIEIISKSFDIIKDKVRYILIGEKLEVEKYLLKINSSLKINKILDPFNFMSLDRSKLNIFDTSNLKPKSNKILTQLNFCNFLSNKTRYDLVTMPINKSIIKKNNQFNGVTEYMGKLNNKKTIMLMFGEKFSVIPITTHINLKDIGKNFSNKIQNFLNIFEQISINTKFLKTYNEFIFLCFNPHCSENNTLGNEDLIIKNSLKKIKNFKFKQMPADSAFKKYEKKTLFVSFYHDQALIPFKILNKKSFNQTLGLNYRRLSPSHGTAVDIKFQNLADNTSYIQCMIN